MTFYGREWPEVETPDPATDPAPVAPPAPDAPVRREGVEGTGTETGAVLDEVRSWFARYVSTMREDDLDLLTLWAAHTHLAKETYTTPRLVIDSPVPGSGKTTVLEHMERLCVAPVQMAALSSPALLARMLNVEMRTILIDEADRSLDPKKEGIAELMAILNSGYKRGGARPVLTPSKGGEWKVQEMPTFSPVAMAGNNPQLPEDTKSRCIRVLLLPDLSGSVEESDWEVIDDDARNLGYRLAVWAEQVRDEVRLTRPPLPEGVKGRNRERFSPLKRVAAVAGGRWPEVVDSLALHDLEQQELDREDGMVRTRPAVALLTHMSELWPRGETFVSTTDLINGLIFEHPDQWGESSPYGRALTAQRFGRMLASSYGINSTRIVRGGPRGYTFASLEATWNRMGIAVPVAPAPPQGTGASGATGGTGADHLNSHSTNEPSADECGHPDCHEPPRPGRVMCPLHFTREPAGGTR